MIVIPEPWIPSPEEESKDALYEMKVRIQRMEYMMHRGYYVREYSDDNWEKFKKHLNQIKDE